MEVKTLSKNMRDGVKLTLAIAVICAVVVLASRLGGSEIAAIGAWLQEQRSLAAAIILVVHVIATSLGSPSFIFIALAGYLFGIPWGLALGYASTILAAAAAFVVGRTIGRRWVQDLLAENRRLKALDLAVRENGFSIVLLSRLSIVLPMNLLNYGYAITRVSFKDYFLGTALGLIPAISLFALLGSSVDNVAQLATMDPTDSGAGVWLFWIGLGLAAAVTVWVAKLTGNALERALAEAEHNLSKPPSDATKPASNRSYNGSQGSTHDTSSD